MLPRQNSVLEGMIVKVQYVNDISKASTVFCYTDLYRVLFPYTGTKMRTKMIAHFLHENKN